MIESEPVGLMFCLDCMFKHARDLEHHLEDAVRVTSEKEREEFENMIDTVRGVRKTILEKMKTEPEECTICSTDLPPRGTGLEIGTAREERGKGKPLSEEERKKRHSSNPVGKESKIVKIEGEKYRQVIEHVKPKEEFAPESFRTICPKCPPYGYAGRCENCPSEIAQTTTMIIIGCPAGEWNAETERCKVSTEIHTIYHELEPVR